MVRVHSTRKQNKRLSPLGFQVTRLFKDACKIIEADDSSDNIIYMLTGTIRQLNKLLIKHLRRPSKMEMN